jgi:hypothetical protein
MPNYDLGILITLNIGLTMSGDVWHGGRGVYA